MMTGVEEIASGTQLLGYSVALAGGMLLLTALGSVIFLDVLPRRTPMAGESYGWEKPLLEAQEPMSAEPAKILRAA